jgi:PAS domain S-box-containing protein
MIMGDERAGSGAPVSGGGGHATVLVRAEDGMIVGADDAFDEMFGYGPGELRGRRLSAVTASNAHTPGQRAAQILAALRDDGVHGQDLHGVRKDGTEFWSRANLVAFTEPEDGTLWIAVDTDLADEEAPNAAAAGMEADRLRALQINHTLVSSLVIAMNTLDDTANPVARSAIRRALAQAQRHITDLLGGRAIGAGDLQRPRTPTDRE